MCFIYSFILEEKIILKDCDEDFTHSIGLSTYADFEFTNCTRNFQSVLDYVFFETNSFELKKVVPFSEAKYKEKFQPSQFIPSDHVAILFELLMK
jgi:mRNA deadenylase 3'-5' endonuclease subunit Ccr4